MVDFHKLTIPKKERLEVQLMDGRRTQYQIRYYISGYN